MQTPLTDFHARLARHDWTHAYTDDPSVYRRGRAEQTALEEISRESAAHNDLFFAWCKFIFGGGDKPVAPSEELAA